MATKQILVVEFDADERNRISQWLEEAGFDVLVCPGPSAPDFTCVGGRTGRCPLAEAAGLVILDLSLGSDLFMTGTPAWEIMLFYAELGKKLIVISGHEEAVSARPDDRVAVVRRPYDRSELLDSLRRLGDSDAA